MQGWPRAATCYTVLRVFERVLRGVVIVGEGVAWVLQLLQVLHGFLVSLGGRGNWCIFAVDKTLKDNDMKKEVETWLENGADYGEGVELLRKWSRNRMLVRRYERSTAQYLGATLRALLIRMAGATVQQTAQQPRAAAVVARVQQPRAAAVVRGGQQPRTAAVVAVEQPRAAAEVPEAVAEAKSLLHELWVAMSQKQEELRGVGDGNSEAEVAERKRIMAERDPIIKDYNELYGLKEQYFESGEVPDELVKMVKRLRGEATEQTAKSLWADMGDLELTKARKAKKMQLTRCENQLNYQSNRREAERKPMPDGPKRHQIESKLKTLQAELRDMDLEIERRGI